MKNTTLCYIEKDGKYLMLHRVKKKNDENQGKYIGIGGHFLENESPFECIVREAKEETGLILKKPEYRGIVTFSSDIYETEQMHLFTCKNFEGEIITCNEGNLEWVDKGQLNKIPLWQGDMLFLTQLEKSGEFFNMKLVYKGEDLQEAYLNNEKIL